MKFKIEVKIRVRGNNRKPIARNKKLPQFTTMNVIDGQAGLVNYSSLIFYSLTIDNILNIVSIAMLTGENGILTKANDAKDANDYAGAKESVQLEIAGSFDENGNYDPDLAKENLEKNLGAIVTKNPDGSLDVIYKGYHFKISANGNLTVSEERKYVKVSAGENYSLAIDEEGNLWAWGDNSGGQLGDGTKETRTSPIQIKSGTKFKEISAGENYSLAIDEEGNLWTWGNNTYGQLGDGTTVEKLSPIQIKEGTKFKEISAGRYHGLAIDEEGNLWAWGRNGSGQLGDGTKVERLNPIQINLDINIKAIEATSNGSIVIDLNNTLWQTGSWSYCSLVDVTYPTLERIY